MAPPGMRAGGRPLAYDRLFALRLGPRAARLVLAERFGTMAAMRGGDIVDVPIAEAVKARKTLTDSFLDRYESFFPPIGGGLMSMTAAAR